MANRKALTIWNFTPPKRPSVIPDLSGQQFGLLWSLGFAGISAHSHAAYWLCECDCGEYVFINSTQLTRTDGKETRSCGCLHKQPKSHGFSKTVIHKAWSDRKQRCFNPNSPDYPDYGGRGITMCQRWLTFENFLEDVMAEIGEAPSPKHTLDRINNNGNYEPRNIRWATPKEQARNRRTSKMITFNNQTHSLAEWAERIGIGQNTLGWRLLHGWSTERALTAPVMYYHPL